MSDPKVAAPAKAAKQSSPRYPFIALGKALERAEEFKKAAGANAALISDARTAWGYAAKSSGGDQTVAALSYYGLLDDAGSGDNRRIKLSEMAQRYFRDERPEVRADLLARFALMPKAMSKLWEMWKHEPPGDAVARSILKVDLHYSDWAATELLKVYRENLQYVPAKTSATIPPNDAVDPPLQAAGDDRGPKDTVKIGQYVQWTSGGVDQFKVPVRVTWISDDGTHLRVHGHLTGIPMNEVTVMQSPKPPAHGVTANSAYGGIDGELSVLLTGNRLQITAEVDRAGIARLKEILTRYDGILELMEPKSDSSD